MCRTEEETTRYNEDEARREEQALLACVICDQKLPQDDFARDNVCLECSSSGEFIDQYLFEDAGGHIHHI